VTTDDFQRHRGGAFLLEYRSSVSDTIMACFPKIRWKEWLFARMPNGFWNARSARRRYMDWLGKRLGCKHLDDWYRVSLQDFRNNYGGMLLRRYRNSVAAAVMDLIPRRAWCEWKFTRVPPGFWDCLENRRRYILWLGKRLGYHSAEDWCRVRYSDFYQHCGGSLVVMYHSVWDLLQECIPEWDWEPYRKRPFSVDQILAWADAFFAAHGKWPSRKSGEIAGTNETWMGIHSALCQGGRGLSGRRTLPGLLSEHRRGRRVARRPSSR
jgi:hypothetical protein